MATNADPASVEKILNLMNQIKTALKTSADEDQVSESKAAADWEALKATIEHTIQDLTSQIHDTQTNISKLEEIIANTKAEISKEQAILTEETTLLEEERVWCSEEDALYENSEKER
jgi:uncharacterized protein involved in exopolysaccharide biosynthesis